MKIVLCTAAVCLVIAASVYTNQKVTQAEARKTRNSMPNILNNPVEGGQSLISRVDSLNASLSVMNKRLTRLEESASRETKQNNDEIRKVTSGIRQELGRLSLKIDRMSDEQAQLQNIPRQLSLISDGMRTVARSVDAKAENGGATSEEMVKAVDWMVQKIEDIDSYFPPLYDFLGAVYTGDGTTLEDYPSVDLRLNEVILTLEKIQQDAAATRKLVTPYVIEPGRYPRPLEEDEGDKVIPLKPIPFENE